MIKKIILKVGGKEVGLLSRKRENYTMIWASCFTSLISIHQHSRQLLGRRQYGPMQLSPPPPAMESVLNQIKGFLLYLSIVTVVLIITAANWLLAKLQPEPEEEIGYESARPNDHKI